MRERFRGPGAVVGAWAGSARVHLATMAMALGAASLGCGASYQSIYEGDVRFEHCYRLDNDVRVATHERLACWSDWSARHTAGQTRDRVEYGRARERALREGDGRLAGPTEVVVPARQAAALQAAQPVQPAQPSQPAQTTPPQRAPQALGDTGGATGAPCLKACGQTLAQCASGCVGAECVKACNDSVQGCLRGCQ